MHAMIQFPDLSPEIFSISLFGLEFALRWYALAYIAGIVIAWRLAVMALNRPALWPGEQVPMRPAQVEDLLTWIVLGVILGGRLGFVLFYQPGYYLSNPSQILRIWEGGMAFHGGLIGVVLASWIYASRHNIPKLQMADLVAFTVPWGLLLGRLSNFVNAELWGRPTDLPWGVAFPGQAAQDCGQAL
jgi:phosphatidylglycerol:prolipoprotein diacylglycerol transferase